VSILATVLVMYAVKLTFNLMTLGGIAAAIGLIIDDAIVVVEAISARIARGEERLAAVNEAMREIFRPLVASTLTPVVVFIPLAFLDGVPGVFFRSLALTMVVSLLASLVLAATLTPTLAAMFISGHGDPEQHDETSLLGRLTNVFARVLRKALDHRAITVVVCVAIALAGLGVYTQLESDFMPAMDEGGFIIDAMTPWGTSLEESDRMMRKAEAILRATPEVEGYSRRTGARLALAIAEPNKGDFLVKLRPDRSRSTEAVKQELRRKLNSAVPAVKWEFPGILGDLLGDLTDSPNPIEIKLFSSDTAWLMKTAPRLRAEIEKIPGVVDTNDGLAMTGPTITFRLRPAEAQRFGLTADDVAAAVNNAMLGGKASSVLEGDRVVAIRVVADPKAVTQTQMIRNLPLRTASGAIVQLSQVADVEQQGGGLELRREDLRQMVAVTAALEGRDLGSTMADVERVVAADKSIPAGSVEFGGLYKQQQESFRNLLVVLALSVTLVFTVLLVEFRGFREPLSIVLGSLLALVGTALGLWLTGTTLNIVSFLGAIIGIGIVAKNGILMLDLVDQHLGQGEDLGTALVSAARRRLRPILMTSLATVLAMLPLAAGLSHGGEMLRPLAIGIIGALCVSMMLSLIATPTFYTMMQSRSGKAGL
jgi:multidrug efflux pump subunit AcrB